MYTQCPECLTAFRVTPALLQQASGRVRCGGCSHAFNALEHLSEEPPLHDEAPRHEDTDWRQIHALYGVLVGPMVGAIVGSTSTVLFYEMAWWTVWPKYVIGDALGVLVVAPVILAWRNRRTAQRPVEAAALSLSTALVVTRVQCLWSRNTNGPLPRSIGTGFPPTDRNDRTGLFTPPGIARHARSKSRAA